MKPYTDIEQSKQLAEILPIDTADGYYEAQINPKTEDWEIVLFPGNQWPSPEVVVPCWTLAALLAQIPNPILKRIADCWQCVDSHGFNWETFRDDPIDACVEMITILNKENEL